MPYAWASAYMKPVQPAERSYAAASTAPSASARIAAVDGNAMSGVTVATMRRSMSLPASPACASASRAAGSARSESASSGAAIRRSRMPVRSTIHSFDVSTNCASSSFVTTRSGTLHPSPVIDTSSPFLAVPIIRRRRRQDRLGRKLAVDARPALALGDRAAHADELALEREDVPRLDDPLEAAVVDAGEERDLPAVRLVGEDGDGAGLRDRLDREHAGHDRPLGEVAREPPVVGADLAPADDALAGLELDDLVDEQERRAVRDELHDHVPAERGPRRAHATLSSSRSRIRLRPRCAWHLAVPTGMPAASAISSNE